MLSEERVYPVTKELMCNAIWDMAELQKGKKLLSDPWGNTIDFSTEMYDIKCNYHFTLLSVPEGCMVRLEMGNPNASELIYRAFVLLESLMAKRPNNDGDRRNGA